VASFPFMALSLIAIIGKKDEPIYFWSEESDEEALNLKQLAHGALDVVDERMETAKASQQDAKAPAFEPYLGKLMSSGDYEVFGYLSNTRIKVIVVCGMAYQSATEDGSPRNKNELMHTFVSNVYGIYSNEVRNPLQPLNDLCRSDKFNEAIAAIARNFTSNMNLAA
jgi:hypothetical protein